MKAFTLVATLLLSTAAHATTLTTGIGFGLNALDCRVLNASSKPVEVESVTIFDDQGKGLSTFSNCTFPGQIFPGLACFVKISSSHYGRCVIVAKGSSKSLRGTLLLFGDGLGAAETILEAR
jgi:hypothetical protein